MKKFFFIVTMVGIMMTGCQNGTTMEETSVEDVLVDETPVENVLVDETPVEDVLVEDENEYESESGLYVDLGLPSGTRWAKFDSYNFISYKQAYYKYGKQLPTREQCEELLSECTWRWNTVVDGMSTEGSGYEVIGPNGNSIYLKANGYISSWGGSLSDVGVYGRFLSSTPYSSEYSWGISIEPDRHEVCKGSVEASYSVRLVSE